jgi:hypothetical protein
MSQAIDLFPCPNWLSESEAGVSRPPAPREPEHSPARNRLSRTLAIRASEHSGLAHPTASSAGAC